eukprot:FR742747.1.p2 GENE.FR742747.1~~FR742747.1.p2  ORF type:complete len:184 (+),score=98.20 FR742747.1:578-1129(+)
MLCHGSRCECADRKWEDRGVGKCNETRERQDSGWPDVWWGGSVSGGPRQKPREVRGGLGGHYNFMRYRFLFRPNEKKKKKKKKNGRGEWKPPGPGPGESPCSIKGPPPAGEPPLFFSPFLRGKFGPPGRETRGPKLFLLGGKFFLSPPPNFPPTNNKNPEKKKKGGKARGGGPKGGREKHTHF